MEQVMDRVVVLPAPLPPLEVIEESPWPEQGQWTYDDYLRLPDDGNRYEIIEGVLYMVNAPGYDHQYVVSEMHLQMGNFVKSNRLGIVMTAPFEIHLSETSRPVQPDVFFIAAERQPQSGDPYFEGAPDLVVEVISPSSIRLDRFVKFDAYERAGVREYWIVDPGTHSVEVYVLDKERVYALLGQFRGRESVRSLVLEGFSVAVVSLFAE